MPPRYGLAGAPPCRPAQPVPQPPPTPNPPHPTTETHVPPQQGQASKPSQAKPSRTRNIHAGENKLHKVVNTCLCAPERSGHAAPFPSSFCTLRIFALIMSPRGFLARSSLSTKCTYRRKKNQKVISLHNIFMLWRRRTKQGRAYKRIWNQRVKNRRVVCDASCTH